MDLFRNINIQVSSSNFYGIEVNDFAVSVAKTALWIAEAQMLDETNNLLGSSLQFLPLKSFDHIVEGNALRMDWNEVIHASELNYIMGNPPFVGYVYQTKDQKEDLKVTGIKVNSVDYVAGWYYQACKYINETKVKVAFVSTNSITQGEQVTNIWKDLYNNYPVEIDFAYKTFIWDSETSKKAHVHCVIIGFSLCSDNHQKVIYDNNQVIYAKNINPYLQDAQPIFLERRAKPINDVPKIGRGSQPTDNGNFILSKDEYTLFKEQYSDLIHLVRKYIGAKELINGGEKYCLWLANAQPQELKNCKFIIDRINNIREFRSKSTKAATRKKADTPTLFDENHQPNTTYIAIPEVSSERRNYIPMNFLTPDIVCNNGVRLMPNATLFHFGILNSVVHNAWMRVVCGRLESRYDYSISIVYNNFIWAEATDQQKEQITKTAQAILDARALYPDSSLADLYDPLTMPSELLKAHKANDKAVLALYGFKSEATEEEIIARLFELYQQVTKKQYESIPNKVTI